MTQFTFGAVLVIASVLVLIVSAELFMVFDAWAQALIHEGTNAGLLQLLGVLTMFAVAWVGAAIFNHLGSWNWRWPVVVFWMINLAVQVLASLDAAMRSGRYP